MNFKKILDVGYTHSYFKDSRAPDLFTMIPLRETQQTLNNLQLQFKETPEGFFVSSLVDVAGDDYFITPCAATSLSFSFYSNNEYLENFSEMDYITPGEEIFYQGLESTTTDFQLTTHYPLLLKGLLVHNVSFTVTRIDPASAASKPTATATEGDDGLFYLDISHWPDALYEVSDSEGESANSAGDDLDSFYGQKYFASRDLIAHPPLLIVEWLMPQTMPADPESYCLQICSRAVYWQYQSNPTLSTGTDLSVDASQAVFTGGDDYTGAEESVCASVNQSISFGDVTESQDNRWVCFSEEKIVLTQAPWAYIKLNGQLDQSEQTLIDNLPNPNVADIYPYDPNDPLEGFPGEEGDFYATINVEL